ncbi:hypothetical protein G6F36_016051 [Rhizopus arrhizus]|nr:hypothetical protein G6F36_016051 [Rhizopus arrhizus]
MQDTFVLWLEKVGRLSFTINCDVLNAIPSDFTVFQLNSQKVFTYLYTFSTTLPIAKRPRHRLAIAQLAYRRMANISIVF